MFLSNAIRRDITQTKGMTMKRVNKIRVRSLKFLAETNLEKVYKC